MTRPTPWPMPQAEARLLADLLANKPTARGRFAEAVYEPLVAVLAWRHPLAGEDAVVDAAGDALLSFLDNPTRYDPAKRGLRGYLVMAATGDLLNRRRRDNKHHADRVPLEDVEDRPAGGNNAWDGPGWDDPAVVAALARLTGDARRAVELIRDRVRATAAFAALPGIARLPAGDRARGVKRLKDRALKQLQRELRGVR